MEDPKGPAEYEIEAQKMECGRSTERVQRGKEIQCNLHMQLLPQTTIPFKCSSNNTETQRFHKWIESWTL